MCQHVGGRGAGRRAHPRVALPEEVAAGSAAVEVWQDHEEAERRPDGGERRDGLPNARPPLRKPDIEAERDDGEGYVLFGHRGERGGEGEPAVAPAVERPYGGEQERRGERDGVEVPDGFAQELRAAVVREDEGRGDQRQLWQAAARQQEEREAAQRERDALQYQQRAGAAMDQVERRDEQQDRLDVQPEPRRRSLPVDTAIGEAERMAVEGIPDGLVHVAQIEGVSVVRGVSQEAVLAEHQRVERHADDDQRPGQAKLELPGAYQRPHARPCASRLCVRRHGEGDDAVPGKRGGDLPAIIAGRGYSILAGHESARRLSARAGHFSPRLP